MKKFFINIVDDETKTYPVEGWNKITISRKQYTELLCNISEANSIDVLLKTQIFSCGQCRSFSVTAEHLYSVLNKIAQDENIAEIIASHLKAHTDIDSWYFELLDQPDEISEKYLGDDDDFYDILDKLKSGNFIIEEGEVFEFPYEECVFVFDPRCSCSRILRS